MPKSLQQRISALLLHASVAVGIPEGSKYSCSPRAIATSLYKGCILERYPKSSPNDVPALAYESIFPANNLRTYIGLAARCKTPCTRSKGLVEYTPVFDFR